MLWRELEPYLGAVPARVGNEAFGLIMDTKNPKGFDYIAGFEVSNDKNLPSELVSIKIPAQEYAIFVHLGHVSKIRDRMAVISNEWLPSSGYRVALGSGKGPGAIEHYGEGFNPGTGNIEVWIPIEKA